MGQFKPADFSKGDPNTIGGYMAVHDRPAAFEGSDGSSYSVEIVVDENASEPKPFAAYVLFVRWGAGEPFASGHLETSYLFHDDSAAAARAGVGALSLQAVRDLLEEKLAERKKLDRPWWESMHDEDVM